MYTTNIRLDYDVDGETKDQKKTVAETSEQHDNRTRAVPSLSQDRWEDLSVATITMREGRP